MNIATIVYVVDPVSSEVLMAKKTRKVGVGYWFGYGGKLEEGETLAECTVREFEKESGGVKLDKNRLELVALIDFYKGEETTPIVDDPLFKVFCYRILISKAEMGAVVSTPEMDNPTWFSILGLPWKEMKPGDELFVPQIITGTIIKGFVWFSTDEKTVYGSKIKPCTAIDLTV